METDAYGQPLDPEIRLEATNGETTLWIGDRQAMQAWERDLMLASADILVQHGTDFLEVGLGLALSAGGISAASTTRRHVVIEKYRRVIDLFLEHHQDPPASMEIVEADVFDWVKTADSDQFDGILFDPSLPVEVWNDVGLWNETVPHLRRLLRPAGVFIPFFNTAPALREQYVDHFDVAVVVKMPYAPYAGTRYKHTPTAAGGDAYLQCFYATPADAPSGLRLPRTRPGA
jgi:spermidine synthase